MGRTEIAFPTFTIPPLLQRAALCPTLWMAAAVVIIGPMGSQASQSSPALTPWCAASERCGYIDAQGRVVIPAVFASASDFSEDLALVRRWGRIGSVGRERIDLHPSRPVAQIALEKWLDRKRRRGYLLRA